MIYFFVLYPINYLRKMPFKFKHSDTTTIATLRQVLHITDESEQSSENHILVMFKVDHTGNKNVMRLVDGNNVGRDVAYVVHQSDLTGLPVVDHNALESKTNYTFELIPSVEASKCYYQLFIGDMYASTPSMTSWYATADETLIKMSELLSDKTNMPHAYILKHEFQKEHTYIPIRNC